MDLFHGTSTVWLDEILTKGLVPGKARNDKWNSGWSAPADLVYLTQYWAAFYAFYSAAQMPTDLKAKHIPVIIKLSIDVDCVPVFPDEDFIRLTLLDPNSRELAEIALLEFPDLTTTRGIDPTEKRWRELGVTWQESLQTTGTVSAYAIGPESIVGYYEMPTEQSFKTFANNNGPLPPSTDFVATKQNVRGPRYSSRHYNVCQRSDYEAGKLGMDVSNPGIVRPRARGPHSRGNATPRNHGDCRKR
jgi:hypothetical protein